MLLNAISIVTLATAALADIVALKVVGTDGHAHGYATSVHGNQHVNFFIVTDRATELTFDDNLLSLEHDEYDTYYVGSADWYFALGDANTVTPTKLFFDEKNVLQTKKRLWKCKNFADPMNLSKDHWMLAFGDKQPSNLCIEIKIHLETRAENVYLTAVKKNNQLLGILDDMPAFDGTKVLAVAETPGSLSLVYKDERLTHSWDVLDDGAITIYNGFFVFSSVLTYADIRFDENDRIVKSRAFWACKDVGDPRNYSRLAYVIMYGSDKPNNSCVEVDIEKILASHNVRDDGWEIVLKSDF